LSAVSDDASDGIPGPLVDLGEAIAETLTGQTLLAADQVLDDVRRLVWTATFSGLPMKDLSDTDTSHPRETEIARLLHGRTALEARDAPFVARTILLGRGLQEPRPWPLHGASAGGGRT
jgi:hypothetical protein